MSSTKPSRNDQRQSPVDHPVGDKQPTVVTQSQTSRQNDLGAVSSHLVTPEHDKNPHGRPSQHHRSAASRQTIRRPPAALEMLASPSRPNSKSPWLPLLPRASKSPRSMPAKSASR
ncbi:hypothetical protein CTRI78_v000955 [Colletotrichum trifolii]|uniref:Uncharacterized protein n=1 Tax=Colletotrichum trifolii TaxID=5466 RepID=A0A4R8RQT1_COLTR|nr:hypothetical protein CTRI78_v000955 [Colletotrichum trifolii]